MRAYKKLPQLYDVSVLVATLDQSESGVQGRFDAQGVSFRNAQEARPALPRRVPMGPLALLEALDRDGMVRQAWRIERWPVTIGRALDNDVVLTEPHVAPHHATIDLRAGGGGRRCRRRSSSPPARPTTASASAASASPAAPRCTFVDTGRDLDLHIGRTALGCACRGMRWRRS